MKKMLCALLSLAVVFGTGSVFAKSSSSGSKKMDDAIKAQNTERAGKYKKDAEAYDKKASEAEKAGNKELAELYKKCAECCKNIASAIGGENKGGMGTVGKAMSDLSDLKKQARDYETGVKKPAAADASAAAAPAAPAVPAAPAAPAMPPMPGR